MTSTLFLLSIAIFLSPLTVLAKSENHFTIKNTEFVLLKSQQTGQEHELIIFLPASYSPSSGKKYPVLYFLDAYWDMPLLSAIYGSLVYDNVVPEFIMVGFSYPGDNVNYDEERLRDLTPTKVDERGKPSGGAAAFLGFIKETVVPAIEAKYRVDSHERALAGSSLGGLFTLYAMYEDPVFFDRYIAISPAASWDNGYLAQLDAKYAKSHQELNARLFVSYGSDEYQPFRDPIVALQQQLSKRHYQGLQLLNYKMESLRHAGVKGEGFVHGLMWAWKDIAPNGASGLERSYMQPDRAQ